MYQRESESRKRARRVVAATGHHLGKLGGHMRDHPDKAEDVKLIEKAVHEHEDHEHGGRHTRLRLADGGSAEGEGSKRRGDRGARGKHGGTNVNVIVAPRPAGGGMPPGPMGMGAAPPPMAPPPHPMPAPPPPMPPGGGGMPPGMPVGAGPMPPRPPMGMPPGMPPGAVPMRKAGGRAGRPEMWAGKGSGQGRLEESEKLPKYQRHQG